MNASSLPLNLKVAPEGNVLSQVQKLAAFDFERINQDVRRKYGWSPTQCVSLELRVKQLMALSFLDAGGIHAPDADVDEYWHRMILHTKWYKFFCGEVFGRFFHHNVESPISEATVSMCASTRALLAKWFIPPQPPQAVTHNNDSNCNNEPSCNNDSNCNNNP